MYFHGLELNGRQLTRRAISTNGIHFKVNPEILTPAYLRVFQYNGYHYCMSMPGMFYRSLNGLNNFERGPRLFSTTMRHTALRVAVNQLKVFWINVGDSPERILLSTIELTEDWLKWKPSAPMDVLRPEEDWEGGDLEAIPSVRGSAQGRVCQLRDPAIYEEYNMVYMLYSVAGESCIAIAELKM